MVRAGELDPNTPQTPGMNRAAAINAARAGAEKLWAGTVVIHPDAKTGAHHHGALESVIYVVSGRARMRWGERLEFMAEAGPGDFIYVPPYVPHQEINASPDAPLSCVVVRSGQEPVVVNLDLPAVEPNPSRSTGSTTSTRRLLGAWLFLGLPHHEGDHGHVGALQGDRQAQRQPALSSAAIGDEERRAVPASARPGNGRRGGAAARRVRAALAGRTVSRIPEKPAFFTVRAAATAAAAPHSALEPAFARSRPTGWHRRARSRAPSASLPCSARKFGSLAKRMARPSPGRLVGDRGRAA